MDIRYGMDGNIQPDLSPRPAGEIWTCAVDTMIQTVLTRLSQDFSLRSKGQRIWRVGLDCYIYCRGSLIYKQGTIYGDVPVAERGGQFKRPSSLKESRPG
jgi:hypothetical protein